MCTRDCQFLQNRELNLKVQKLQDELQRPKAAGALATSEAGPPTYSMKKAQAKADEEAQADIKKYKSLYDTGAKRIARFQQEVECQKIALEKHEKQKKELQGKVALLQDQLESIHTRSVCQSPNCDVGILGTCVDGTSVQYIDATRPLSWGHS